VLAPIKELAYRQLTPEEKIKSLDDFKEQLLKKLAERMETTKQAEKDGMVDRIIGKVGLSY
jgi:hypothetical protein